MINSFSSYLELFAGLNLGYATIKGFQEAANNELFGFKETYDTLENQIKDLEAKLVLINPDAYTFLWKDFEDSKAAHRVIVKQIISLGSGFQVLFLMTSLFCFLAILLGGFESYYDNKYSVIKTLSWLNASYIVPLGVMVGFNLKKRKNPYSILVCAFFALAACLVTRYSIYHDCPVSFILLKDGSLLTTYIFLMIPPSSFVVFYFRRYSQAKKAQVSIDTFVKDFRQRLNGFNEGVNSMIKIGPNTTTAQNGPIPKKVTKRSKQ